MAEPIALARVERYTSSPAPIAELELTIATPAPLATNPAAVYLARLAPGSRRTMREGLAKVAELLSPRLAVLPRDDPGRDSLALPWSELRYQHTAFVRAQLAASYAPATANKLLAALRGVLGEAYQLGLLPGEDYHRAVRVASIKASTLPRGRALPPAETTALFASCAVDPSPWGARDAAILGVLYGCGIRRQELVSLELTDLDLAGAALVIHAGKGRKDRRAFLDAGALTALSEWLAIRGELLGPLFSRIAYPSGRILWDSRLSAESIARLLQKRGGEALVPAFSPHDLRRTFITDLLDAGADLSTVKDLAGHASITTTVRYDRRGEAAQRKARGLIRVPYRGRNA